MVVLNGQGWVMGSTKRRTWKGSLQHEARRGYRRAQGWRGQNQWVVCGSDRRRTVWNQHQVGDCSTGPGPIRCTLIFQLFKLCSNFVIQICGLPDFQKSPKFESYSIWTWWTTLSIGSTSEFQKNLSYNIWNKLFFEFLTGLNLWEKFWEIH
jgi:hypothetical protein